jgi:hypothetical protein
MNMESPSNLKCRASAAADADPNHGVSQKRPPTRMP